ncbi:MAG: type IX secretion system plug protein domain-containing protein, partial [Sediminibacterium sp.]
MKNWMTLICLYFLTSPLLGQVDRIMDANIKTVLIFPKGKPLALPVIGLNIQDELLIQFDDLSAKYKQFYFTIELMDINWQPVALNPFDYTRGLTQNNIREYTISSIAQQVYFHYSFTFPTTSCRPTNSGNYLMKVFRQGRPNELVFTKRFFVTEQEVPITASIQEPF